MNCLPSSLRSTIESPTTSFASTGNGTLPQAAGSRRQEQEQAPVSRRQEQEQEHEQERRRQVVRNPQSAIRNPLPRVLLYQLISKPTGAGGYMTGLFQTRHFRSRLFQLTLAPWPRL